MITPTNSFQGLQVTFNTTEDCNLACKYCYEINKKPKTLDLESAKKFIDTILTDPDPILVTGTDKEWVTKRGLVLDFIGGDSLMNVGLVKNILDYFQERAWALNHKWATRWRASISTNGTLFDMPGVKDFMEEYGPNLSVGISIDGCPEVHDRNRVFKDGSGSMAVILKNWDYYRDWCFRFNNTLSTKSTLNLESIPYLFESVKFLHETLGMNEINMNFVMEDMGVTQDHLDLLDKELERVKDYVIEHRHELYLGLFNKDMCLGKTMDSQDNKEGRCGSGSMPALGINGKIYPCFRYLPHTVCEGRKDFSVGSVDEGLNAKENFLAVRSMTRDLISDEECRNCPIETMCPYCIGGCYAEFGEFKRTKYICNISKLQDKWGKMYWREYDRLEGTHTEGAYFPTYEEWVALKKD